MVISTQLHYLKNKMFMKKITTFLSLAICLSSQSVFAQDQVAVDSAAWQAITNLQQQVNYQKPGDSHFMVVGLTTFGFVNSSTKSGGATTTTNTMGDAFEFSPMLLWRQSKKVLLEFEPSYDGNTFGVNWADVSYFAAPGLIIRAGYFVLPFGIYNKRLAAGWINKMATDPVGTADLPPASDFGVEVEGGFPLLGTMKWSYDFSLTNGMQLLPDGRIQNAGITDNNNNKTFTGRLGLLPFSNSSFEIGVSTLFGNVGDANSAYTGAKTNMYAFDLSYVKKIKKCLLNVKGQYNIININDQNYINPADSSTYTFTNKTTSYFAQASLRPAYVSNKILKNFELSFRYANFTTPKNSAWEENTNETDFGLNYWLSWRSVIRVSYELINSTSANIGVSNGTANTNNVFIQYSTEF
jgi:hypothetical protein